MKNEIEQIAQQNKMSIEFVTWFFNEKKSACGEHWFLMLGAMWEGWKGRSIEMDKLAAENVALKQAESNLVRNIINDLGDTEFQYARVQTPATARIVAGIKADGVEEFATKTATGLRTTGGAWGVFQEPYHEVADYLEDRAERFAKQLREVADK